MKRYDEEAIVEEMERDADNAAAWADDPAPSPPQRGLQALISLRLESHTADMIRDLAEQRGVSFSALLREWVEQRLSREVGTADVLPTYEPQEAGVAAGFEPFTATSTRGAKPPAMTRT